MESYQTGFHTSLDVKIMLTSSGVAVEAAIRGFLAKLIGPARTHHRNVDYHVVSLLKAFDLKLPQ